MTAPQGNRAQPVGSVSGNVSSSENVVLPGGGHNKLMVRGLMPKKKPQIGRDVQTSKSKRLALLLIAAGELSPKKSGTNTVRPPRKQPKTS